MASKRRGWMMQIAAVIDGKPVKFSTTSQPRFGQLVAYLHRSKASDVVITDDRGIVVDSWKDPRP